jgi:hypothetical protein
LLKETGLDVAENGIIDEDLPLTCETGLKINKYVNKNNNS